MKARDDTMAALIQKALSLKECSDVSLILNGNDLYPHRTDIQRDVQITVLTPHLQVNTDLCHNMNIASVLTDKCRLSGKCIVNILHTFMITDDNSQHLKYSVSILYYKCVWGKKREWFFFLLFDVLPLSITHGGKNKTKNKKTPALAHQQQ